MIKRRYNFKEGRLIPRKKQSKPFYFVRIIRIGLFILAMMLYFLYKLMVK